MTYPAALSGLFPIGRVTRPDAPHARSNGGDDMDAWQASLVIIGAGALGGVVSAFLSEDRGFALPKTVPIDGSTVLRPGFAGHVLVGGVASFISWGLYGPGSELVLLGAPAGSPPAGAGMTAGAVAGAMGVGVGGAKFLSNYVDKKVLRATASVAAAKSADPAAAGHLEVAEPTRALQIARDMAA
jgi:hypothetical protein